MTEHNPAAVPEASQAASTETAPQPPKAANPDAKWYILQTYSGFENRVEKTLHEKLKVAKLAHLVEEIFVPGEDVERVKNGKKRKMHVIYYPGYVLIKMQLTDELWHVLMDTPRVAGFVGGTNRDPKPLQESELGDIRSQMTQGIRHATIKDEFEVGQQVVVIDGPFANFNGKVGEVNMEKNRLKVFISILGRSTPVELDFDKVKAHTDAK
jgi:transcriptional antiterminator NusG